MTILVLLIPVTLVMGAVGLTCFFWSLRSGQYEDLSGDGARILFDNDDSPLPKNPENTPTKSSKETAK